MNPFTRSALALVPFLPAWAAPAVLAPPQEHATPVAAEFRHAAPTELFDVERVVDGDTIYIDYHGRQEKLRLLSVDTEEKFDVGPTKPATVFGEACAQWAAEFFAAQAKEGEVPRVGLLFPGGAERRDVYGRLLCHVVLADGTDFNLLLVQLGKSPYFNKYGNSLVCHEEFVKAQTGARAAKRGIWDPATNEPAEEGREAAKRPYEKLLVWWDARAAAIDAFRARHAEAPEACIDAEDPDQLQAALERRKEVEVFCNVNRIFDEADGSRTVLMRSGDKDRSLRVRIPADAWAAPMGTSAIQR